MPADTDAVPTTIDHKPHAAFFRQSGWMMIASIFGGFMSLGVHVLNKWVKEGSYGEFGLMVMVITVLPTIPLQMVFAQQAASALVDGSERQLSGMIRRAWLATFIIWLLAFVFLLVFWRQIIQGWQLKNPAILYVDIFAILASIWLPLFSGVMQGRQDFFWFGWSLILGGIVRLGSAAVLVILFHAGGAGMLAGALFGVGCSGVIAIWRTRDLWSLKPEPFDSRQLLAQIMPLILAFGVCQFLFSSDTMFAKGHFAGESIDHYVAAGTMARALLWLVMPIAAVMFPKIVHSTAKREKTNLLGIVIGGTAILAVCGTIGLVVVGPLVVRIIYTPAAVPETTALIPWYALAMIPLALANVMVNDLMARKQFKVVPFMIVLAIAYGFTQPYMIHHYPGRMTVILQTLGVFTLVLFLICAWFTWGPSAKAKLEVRS